MKNITDNKWSAISVLPSRPEIKRITEDIYKNNRLQQVEKLILSFKFKFLNKFNYSKKFVKYNCIEKPIILTIFIIDWYIF